VEDLNLDALFIPSSPGDAGIALGAAAWYFWQKNGQVPKWGANAFLGGSFSNQEIEEAIKANTDGFTVKLCDNQTNRAAECLARGEIIGWFQGTSEYGPRALGNRSILANPRNIWTKDLLNHQVKGREWFRPYAPSVLMDKANIYFHLKENEEVPFMMKIAKVKKQAYNDIPSCVHVDGTSRLQTVRREINTLYYELLSSFEKLTGIPVVLDTSFNLSGMPIVETPSDAINCFKMSPYFDHLFIGNYQISRCNKY
jgi:carbamoyltransferase